MRTFLFMFTFFAAMGLYGPTAQEAAAQCTHLGSPGACPVGIPNGSNSLSFNSDGTINWSSGGISGPCCPAASGTETGAGLLNLNNQLGGARQPGSVLLDVITLFTFAIISPQGTFPVNLDENGNIDFGPGPNGGFCGPGGGPSCSGGPGAVIFGAGPNSGYLCDAGGPGCGNDLWTSAPQTGFGQCGPGGCTGGSPIQPLNVANIPGTGPYSRNSTIGLVDPFGGVSGFTDPETGVSIELSDDRNEWPEDIKHADELNNAFVNNEIAYPFGDPNWRNRSVEDFKNNPPPPPASAQPDFGFNAPVTFQTRNSDTTAGIRFPVIGHGFNPGPYSQNRTLGDNIDPFGGGGSFTDPVTGVSEDVSDDPAQWSDRIKKAHALNDAYINDRIPYPFNDPDWESKPIEAFGTQAAPGGFGTTITSAPSVPGTPQFGTGIIVAPSRPQGGGDVTHTVAAGENLFRISLQYGVSMKVLTDANGLVPGASIPTGQALVVPGIAPPSATPNFGSSIVVAPADNSDLTSYVGNVLVAIEGKGFNAAPSNFVSVLPVVTPAPASTPAQEDTEKAPEPSVEITNLRFAGSGTAGVARIDTEGAASIFQVTTASGRRIDFKNRSDAFFFSNRLNDNREGKTVDVLLGELPEGRSPINTGPATTNPIDAIAENVPKEFRAPKVNDGASGEFFITDPRTNKTLRVASPQQRDAALNAMRNGATLEQAAEIAKNAPVVTPDGLASATSSSTPRSTRSTPAPAGSAPTFTNIQPAIIVPPATTTTPDGLASANNGGGSTSSTPAPAGSTPTIGNQRPAIIVGAGTNAFSLEPRRNAAGEAIEPFARPDISGVWVVQDPAGRKVDFIFEDQAKAMVMALRRGATWDEAQKTGREVPLIQPPDPNAPTATTTPAPVQTQPAVNAATSPEFRTNLTTSRDEIGSQIDQVEQGDQTTFHVNFKGSLARFESREDAFNFANRLRFDGKTFEETIRDLPNDRRPIPDRPATTNPIDAVAESVPKEFQAPTLTDRMDGEIHDIYITNPRTGKRTYFSSRTQADAVLELMRTSGMSIDEAQAQIRARPTSTPDGLASANSGGATTPSTPAPAGSAPTFTNNRPAIIVTPTRPEGTSAGTMKGLLNGNAYNIEVIRTPDGKTLAVGTGENAGHVFGEVKETSNKLFGDWRREGPWSPPPAKAQTATAPATSSAAVPGSPQGPTAQPATPQTANTRIRSQIANSDRDHMTQPAFTDGFEFGDSVQWRSTGAP